MAARASQRLLLASVILATAASMGCSGRATADADRLTEMDEIISRDTTQVSVFYPSEDIIAEERIEADPGDQLPLVAMRTLFKMHPRDPGLGVTLPQAEVRSVEIRDGVAWVDFSREVLVTGETAKTQRTALAAIIYTLSQFPGVDKVAFTVEGKTTGELGGQDVATFWGDVNLKDMPWDITAKKTSE
jgi:hypothetical protein